MRTVPCRYIVWLALLSVSSGLTAFIAQETKLLGESPAQWSQVSASLPLRWGPEASIPYLGLVTLSGVVVGVGTTEMKRSRQAHSQQPLSTAAVRALPPVSTSLAQVPMVAPLSHYPLCRLRGTDRQQHLAIQVAGEYYIFYRQRPTLDKAQNLVKQWQARGYAALATHDDSDYAVWVNRRPLLSTSVADSF